MKKLTTIIIVMLAAALVITGCNNKPTSTKSSTASDGTSQSVIAESSNSTGSDSQVTESGSAISGDSSQISVANNSTASQSSQKPSTSQTSGGIASKPSSGEQGITDASKRELFAKRNGVTGKVQVFVPWDIDSTWTNMKTEFQKQYPGTTLDYITSPWQTRDIKLTSLLLAGNAPDAVSTGYFDFPKRAIQKILQPIDDLIVPNNGYDEYIMKYITAWGGKKYATTGARVPNFIYYNTTLFKNAGITDTPLVLFNKNQWTWNKLRELATDLTEDTNNDQKPDIWGFGIDEDMMFPLSQGTDIVKISNNKPVLNIDDPKFRSGLTFLYDMVNKDKSVYNIRWGSFRDGFAKGKVAMAFWRYGDVSYLVDTAKMTNFDVVPFPKAPGQTEYFGYSGADGFGIAVGAKNRIGGMAFSEFYSNYFTKLAKSPLRKKYFTDAQETRLKTIKTSATLLYGLGMDTTFSQDFCNFMRQNGSFGTLLEEFRPKWNKNINDTLTGK